MSDLEVNSWQETVYQAVCHLCEWRGDTHLKYDDAESELLDHQDAHYPAEEAS